MRCPVCSKVYIKAGWLEKHGAQCRGSQPSSALRVGGVDPPNPSHPLIVPTVFDWTWASSFPVSDMVGRRLPRLYRKIPFALSVEARRAYSLPLWRLREDSGDVGAELMITSQLNTQLNTLLNVQQYNSDNNVEYVMLSVPRSRSLFSHRYLR